MIFLFNSLVEDVQCESQLHDHEDHNDIILRYQMVSFFSIQIIHLTSQTESMMMATGIHLYINFTHLSILT